MSDEPQDNQTASTVPVTPDITAELEKTKAQAAENWDKFLRASADLENYRKRAMREKDEIGRFTTERVISAMLPALDNLERALDHSDEGTPLHDGLQQVHKQFQRVLADFGLVELIAKPGAQFDANFQEAVGHIESKDQPQDAIIEQLQSGYKLGDRLLRPARVVVSKGATAK